MAAINDGRVDEKPLAKEIFNHEEVLIEGLPLDESAYDELDEEIELEEDDFIVPKFELEKIRMLLRGREGVEMEIPCDMPKCMFCKSHWKLCN